MQTIGNILIFLLQNNDGLLITHQKHSQKRCMVSGSLCFTSFIKDNSYVFFSVERGEKTWEVIDVG